MLTQAITPAIKSHLDILINFYTDLSRRMLDSMQKISDLNLRLTRDLIAEMGEFNQRLIGTAGNRRPTDLVTPGSAWRHYSQGLADVVAGVNADLAQTVEDHMPAVSRTASAVAEEIMRKAGEETAKASERQKQVLERMGVPSPGVANGHAGRSQMTH